VAVLDIGGVQSALPRWAIRVRRVIQPRGDRFGGTASPSIGVVVEMQQVVSCYCARFGFSPRRASSTTWPTVSKIVA